MNESLKAETSIRLSSSSFSAIFLSFNVIMSGTLEFVGLRNVFVYKCHIVLWFGLVIVGRFVCFHENVLLFSYFLDLTELFLKIVRVGIGLTEIFFRSLFKVVLRPHLH